jgi:hypothetical protein
MRSVIHMSNTLGEGAANDTKPKTLFKLRSIQSALSKAFPYAVDVAAPVSLKKAYIFSNELDQLPRNN